MNKMQPINNNSEGRIVMLYLNYINFSFALLLVLISYLTVSRWYTKKQLNKYQKKKMAKSKTNDTNLKNFISKINFLRTKELFLLKQGYPLRLDSIRYYLFKIVLAGLFLYAGIRNYDSITISIILSLIGFFFIDAFIMVNKKTRDAEICEDLYNVVNSICLQLSAHVSMKDSLKYQFENCKNNDLKKALIEFSTCYELSELNINEATRSLEDKFDILEINMFCNALNEDNQTGNVIEVLENLADSLCEKRVAKIKSDTRTKILYITFGVIIALINIILLIFYPLFISLSTNFNNIFK